MRTVTSPAGNCDSSKFFKLARYGWESRSTKIAFGIGPCKQSRRDCVNQIREFDPMRERPTAAECLCPSPYSVTRREPAHEPWTFSPYSIRSSADAFGAL